MKLLISKSEVDVLLREKFNLSSSDEIEIGQNPIPANFTKFVAEYGTNFVGRQIPAIKELRTILPGLGLADAKWTVENWIKVSTYVHKNHEWPPLGEDGWRYIY